MGLCANEAISECQDQEAVPRTGTQATPLISQMGNSRSNVLSSQNSSQNFDPQKSIEISVYFLPQVPLTCMLLDLSLSLCPLSPVAVGKKRQVRKTASAKRADALGSEEDKIPPPKSLPKMLVSCQHNYKNNSRVFGLNTKDLFC